MSSDPGYEVEFDPAGDNDWLRMRREIEDWGVDKADLRRKRSLRLVIERGVAETIQSQFKEAEIDSFDEEEYLWIAYEVIANIDFEDFERFRKKIESKSVKGSSDLASVVDTLMQGLGEKIINEFDQEQLQEWGEQIADENRGPSEDAQALRQSLSEESSIPEQRFWKEEQRKIAEKRRKAVKQILRSELDHTIRNQLDEDTLDTLAGRTLELLGEDWENLERSVGQDIKTTSPQEFVEETKKLTARRAIESVGWDIVEEIAENLVHRQHSQETVSEIPRPQQVQDIAWRVIRRMVMEDLVPRAPQLISVTGTGLEPIAERIFLDVQNGEIFVDLVDDAIIYDSTTLKIAEMVEERTIQPVSPDRITFIYESDMEQFDSQFRSGTGRNTNR